MCNAWNHHHGCRCGFGGEGHLGRPSGPSEISTPAGRQRIYTDSHVDPNARCPVCRACVFFYQSPSGGRVYFDALGQPWPKHPCTDNSNLERDDNTILETLYQQLKAFNLPTEMAPYSDGKQVPVSSPTLPAWVPALVKVSAGPFLMGSNEKPQHTLTLPDFWIGKTPMTNAQFRPFVEDDGYHNQQYWTLAGWKWCQKERIVTPRHWDDKQWNGNDYPLVGVSWFEAVAYCRWLTAQTGHEFCLPSEAEWEKAARGPDGRIWPWGNTWEAGRCNSKEAGIGKTTPVSQYPNGASPYGVLDMAGNVWEWVATKSDKGYPYQVEDEWMKAYLEADSNRVLRGGSWHDNQKVVRGAYRGNYYVRYRYHDCGLRVASRSPLPGR